jgi:hypothetical protein
MRGGAIMGRSQQAELAFPDGPTLQVWEDMRVHLLHELQEGGDAPDDLIDLMGQLVVMMRRSASVRQRPEPRRLAA